MITPLYLESSAGAPPLRVALLVDDAPLPRYVAAILEDIARSSFARVELAVVVRSPRGEARTPSSLALRIYDRLDRAVARDRDPLAPVDGGRWLAGVDRLEVSSGDGALHLDPAALAAVEARGLDVILRFCTAVPRGAVRRAARAGIWSYHFGADGSPRGGLPFLHDLAAGAPVLEAQLEVLGDAEAPALVLCRSTFAPLGSVLATRQRATPIWETTHFVLWKLHDLHQHGWDRLRGQATPGLPAPAEGAEPTLADMARFFAPRLASNALRRFGLRPTLKAYRWGVALRRTSSPLWAAGTRHDASGFRRLDAPPGHYWADPFLFEHLGRTWLFCEDFGDERGFGAIARAEVASDGAVGPMETCLDPGFHLSFPHVLAHDGEIFMIPESSCNGTVTLYRARRFPDVWAQEKVLFRGNGVDTTLWQEGGRFYFFTTLFDRDDRGMKTLLFVADSLTGAWRQHPASPVSSDVRCARSAGPLFRRGGRFIRPVQNCGPSYGYGLVLEDILALDEERFERRPFCWVEPSQVSSAAYGVHTYGQSGDLEVIDSLEVLPPPG